MGQVKEVTSLANPIIKDIKALTQKKEREQSGAFLAEGLKLIIDALELGWEIRTLVYAKAAKGKPLVEQAAAKTVARGGLVLEVSEKVIGSITRRDNPQMVVGVFEQRFARLEDIALDKSQTYVALDRVRDPGNLGTIIRTADAAGASGVILVGECTDPFSLETVRATMGSIFALPVLRATEAEFTAWAKRSGGTGGGNPSGWRRGLSNRQLRSKADDHSDGQRTIRPAAQPRQIGRPAGAHSPAGACRFAEPCGGDSGDAVRGAQASSQSGPDGMSSIDAKPTLFARPIPILTFVVLAVLADQLIKIAVEKYLPFQDSVEVLPFLALYRTYNLGVAFSMLADMEGWFIVGMRLVIVAFVLWLWKRTPKHRHSPIPASH